MVLADVARSKAATYRTCNSERQRWVTVLSLDRQNSEFRAFLAQINAAPPAAESYLCSMVSLRHDTMGIEAEHRVGQNGVQPKLQDKTRKVVYHHEQESKESHRKNSAQ